MQSLVPNNRRPDITFYRNGIITITATIAKQLSLADGDVISVLQDKGEYLLYVRYRKRDIIGRYECTVHYERSHKKSTKRFYACSRKLTEAIFKAAGYEQGNALKLSAGEPVTIEGYGTAIPLITRNPL